MPPVSLRTSFTDPRGLDSFFCAVVFRFSRSCLVAPTRTSDDPEQKMSPQLWEWQLRQNGRCEVVSKNRNVKRNCAMNFGHELRRMYPMQNRTAPTRRGWQTR